MNELLTLSRMAQRVGVTQAWLRDEATSGRIPSLKAGRRLLFDPVAVTETLLARARNLPRRTEKQSEVRHDA